MRWRVMSLMITVGLTGCGSHYDDELNGGALTDGEPIHEARSADDATELRPVKLVFAEQVSPEQWQTYRNRMAAVERIEFLADDQTELDWSLLDNIDRLERFRFDGPADEALALALAKHRDLRILNVPRSQWTDQLAGFIAELSELTSLRIGGRSLTDQSIQRFALHLKKLRHLHLIDVGMTADSLPAIRDNDTIESLYLDAVEISDDALSDLLKARPDLHLHIDQLHLKSDPTQH